ncbi:MAG: cell wall hydrolase, partial [Lachnospiraceae bacterium]|nr:cell wall hydrolase [Lachnospiraceae bacterium]
MKLYLKRLICAVVAFTFMLTPVLTYASTTSDKIKQVEKEQENTKDKLGETQDTLNQLKDSKQAIQKSLNNLNDQLDEKTEEISDIEEQISEKEQEIVDIEKEYEDALEQADEQYKFIKARIRTIYETGSNDLYDLLFNSGSMAGFLNKAIYISRMNDYDKKMMDKLQNLMSEANAKKERLVNEDQELQALYTAKEKEVDDLEDLVDSTENSLVSYAGAISEKEREALEYEAKLVASQSTLASLKTKLAEEEELARKAEQMAFRDISEVSVGAGDRDLLAAIIQCEAGGEPYAGKIAVGAVIMNRVRSGAFPNTIAGVVYQPMQFQPVRSGRLAIRLSEGANSECYKAADEVMAGANNIGNCLFFRTVVPGIKGTIIGHHVFYLHWTGVASGYGTVEESLDGDASESKAASEAAAAEAASEEGASKEKSSEKSKETSSKEEEDSEEETESKEEEEEASKEKAASEQASKEQASKEQASKEQASKEASEAASKEQEEKAASEEAKEQESKEQASKEASE